MINKCFSNIDNLGHLKLLLLTDRIHGLLKCFCLFVKLIKYNVENTNKYLLSFDLHSAVGQQFFH